MHVYRNLLPVLSLLTAVILGVLPWGLSESGRLSLALLPGCIIFYWVARDAEFLSVFSVFVAGLVLDVLSGSHLGFWTLIYLLIYAISVLLVRSEFAIFGIRGFLFPGVVLFALVAISSLGAFSDVSVPVGVLFVSGVNVLLAYPLVCCVLWIFDRPVLMARFDGTRD